MKLPRDLHGEELAKRLSRLGYQVVRQTGSHLRLTWNEGGQEHHLTIPRHHLAGILREIAEARNLTREELLKLLDL
ncbi:type II toxin-antitoxin system HicA family toxin [Thermus antranikianii]|uniref:Addiction module toxin, HicA family n=1 Tax=Thermus antranikianii TaxID=88190 RepID=A0ABY7RS56_9DEIN|nr:type II toxin-antitoxin system HicA family toxin [Thermus antranikianii]WCM40503.1 addiction module toxin, HicA family [Thermus antranikianii]